MFISIFIQVLIVAGGHLYGKAISSTERMAIGAAAWTTVNALPRALYKMVLVTVGNLVYLTGMSKHIIINIQSVYSAGGLDEDHEPRSEILVLDGEEWCKIGELQSANFAHAAIMMDTASFMEFCN